MTHIGFTGTRRGMTTEQRAALRSVLIPYRGHFHHGDCVGADKEAHVIAHDMAFAIEVHPPTWHGLRAWCRGAINHPPAPYTQRNHAIVDACLLLIAAPWGLEEKPSGTWATIRYARRTGKPVVVVWPDGAVTTEGVERG